MEAHQSEHARVIPDHSTCNHIKYPPTPSVFFFLFFYDCDLDFFFFFSCWKQLWKCDSSSFLCFGSMPFVAEGEGPLTLCCMWLVPRCLVAVLFFFLSFSTLSHKLGAFLLSFWPAWKQTCILTCSAFLLVKWDFFFFAISNDYI